MVPIAERDRRLEPEALDLQKKPPSSNRIVAGLVFESLAAEGDYRSDRTALLAAEELGGDALRSAYRHRQLFLYPLWHLLGQTRAVALARRLPVAGIAVGLLLALVALAFYPATFYVSSSGTLVPAIQQRVYAPMDGIVETVLVKPNDWVGAGQPLLRMRNYDLDLKLRQVEGELAIVSEQIDRRRRRDRSPLDANVAAWDELQGTSVAVLESQQANLRERLSLLQQQSLLSVVNSQVAGRVITWNVHEELKQRAVPMGRLLLEVADTAGEWQLELNLPDRRVGHLWNAVRHSETPLKVEFVMAADPTQRYWGTLLEVAPVTAASTEDGSFVKVRVALDDTGIQVLQTNTEVSARIFCGTASLGYVWLQDVFEFVERQVFFYLW
jgi:multidrug efflux pump subunit AcrA (membrane-fusion protein)